MAALFDIGPVWRGAEPQVVIEFLWRRFDLPGERVWSAVFGNFNFDCIQLSDSAVSHKLAGEPKVLVRTLLCSCLKDTPVSIYRVAQSLTLGDIIGQWFFAIDVFTGLYGRD
jgi:hypothetical protein